MINSVHVNTINVATVWWLPSRYFAWLGQFCLFWITLLNIEAFYSIYIKWLLAILLNLINFLSFCWIYINWVLANLDNFGSLWVILGHFSWIRIILLNFDQLGSCNYNKLCYILVTGFLLFWLTGLILSHFGKLWTILTYFGSFQIISSDFDLLSFIFMIHFASFDSIQRLGTCYLKPFRAFCVTGFFLFWLIFINWVLVGAFCFISIPLDG